MEESLLGKKASKTMTGMRCVICVNMFEEYGCVVTMQHKDNAMPKMIFRATLPNDVAVSSIMNAVNQANNVHFPQESRRVFTGVDQMITRYFRQQHEDCSEGGG